MGRIVQGKRADLQEKNDAKHKKINEITRHRGSVMMGHINSLVALLLRGMKDAQLRCRRFECGEPLPVSSHSSRPELACIKQNICTADQYAGDRQNHRRDIRVDQFVEVVKQEAAMIGLDSGSCFEPVLKQC